MASNAASFARRITVWRDAALSPAALSANLATFARRQRDDLIASGAAAPTYQTIVDGRQGASEDTVRPDGAILYRFNILPAAVQFVIGYLIARSPVDSGDYQRAWFVAVDGRKWTGDLVDIPFGAEVMISNPMPYARKIDVGHMRMSVPPGIVEDARQAVRRRYPTLSVQRTMALIPAGMGGGYRLRGRFRKGIRQHARTKLRSDTRAGAEMTYPTLVLTQG